MILYVARRCESAERFGGIKLNKILWRADFESYPGRSIPVTGRPDQRLRPGPAPKEMVPVHREMLSAGAIKIETVEIGDDVVEERVIACSDFDLRLFTSIGIEYVDDSIRHSWTRTGMEANDDSHGAAWRTRSDQEPMPYESALLSDERPGTLQMTRLRRLMPTEAC